MMSNNVVTLLREQLKGAGQVLEGTMEGVAAEHAQWTPPGTANPLGATYAHILTTEDALINGIIKGAAPLFASTWAGKIGVSEPLPSPDPNKPGLPDWAAWSRRVQVDVAALREYAQAVYAAADEYLASVSDEDLGRSIDLSGLGLGERSVGSLLGTVIANTHWHTGEIACLKGLQGLRGYPF
jgi:hypothetical protein